MNDVEGWLPSACEQDGVTIANDDVHLEAAKYDARRLAKAVPSYTLRIDIHIRQNAEESAQAGGADVRVRLAAILVDAAAEGLGRGQQLNVHFKLDDGLILGEGPVSVDMGFR